MEDLYLPMDAELPYYHLSWARCEAYLKRERKMITNILY